MVGVSSIKSPLKSLSIFELTKNRKKVLDYVAYTYGCWTRDELIFFTKKQFPYTNAFDNKVNSFLYPIISEKDLKNFFNQQEKDKFKEFSNSAETSKELQYT